MLLALVLAAAPQFVFQGAHATSPTSFLLSPDGHTVLASNPYEPARVWDLETFQLVRVLGEQSPGVFSQDGARVGNVDLATGARVEPAADDRYAAGRRNVFDLDSAAAGRLNFRAAGNQGGAWSSLAACDCKRLQLDPRREHGLLSGGKSVALVDLATPSLMVRIDSPLTGEQAWGYGAGGALVLGVSLDEIVVLDPATLALKQRLPAPRQLPAEDHPRDPPNESPQVPPVQLGSAAFVYVHGQVVHLDPVALTASRPVALRHLGALRGDGAIAVQGIGDSGLADDDEMLRVFDAWTGEQLFTFGGTSSYPPDVHFSREGHLVWMSPGPMNGGVSLYEGQVSRVFDLGGASELFSGPVAISQLSPDARFAALGGQFEPMQFRSLETGAVQKVPKESHLRQFPFQDRQRGVWSRGSRRVAYALGDSVAVWDTEKAVEVLYLEGTPEAKLSQPILSPDGALLGVVEKKQGEYSDGRYRLYDLATGQVLAKGAGVPLVFSRDGQQVALADQHRGLTGAVIDARTGAHAAPLFVQTRFHEHDYGDPVAFANRFEVELWAQETSWHLPAGRLARSPDGVTVALGALDGTITLFDGATGVERKRFAAHDGPLNALRFSPDGKRLLSFGLDRITHLWDAQSGEKIASFAATSRSRGVVAPELVTFTPEGYYFGQRMAVKLIAVRSGVRALPIAQFDAWLNRPDIVLARLGSAPASTAGYYRLAHERRLAKLGLTGDAPPLDLPTVRVRRDRLFPATKERRLVLPVEATARGAPIAGVQVYANGVPLFGPKGTTAALVDGAMPIAVDLASGDNKLEVTALDTLGRESVAEVLRTRLDAPARKPDLYLLAVGVSRYAQPDYTLLYAAKDAQDLLDGFSKGKPFTSTHARIHTKAILDQEATRENILAAREFLAQAQLDDHVIVFFAGHGLLDARAGYYFATTDLDFEHPEGRGLTFEQLESLLTGLTARHRLMLVDTCAAGETDEDEVARSGSGKLPAGVLVASRGLKRKDAAQPSVSQQLLLTRELFAGLRRGSGASIIGSSSGVEYAFETGELKNGVFTAALLETLDGELWGDNVNLYDDMSPAAIEAAVRGKVEQRTHGLQHPVARQINLDDPFTVWLQPDRNTRERRAAPRRANKRKK